MRLASISWAKSSPSPLRGLGSGFGCACSGAVTTRQIRPRIDRRMAAPWHGFRQVYPCPERWAIKSRDQLFGEADLEIGVHPDLIVERFDHGRGGFRLVGFAVEV